MFKRELNRVFESHYLQLSGIKDLQSNIGAILRKKLIDCVCTILIESGLIIIKKNLTEISQKLKFAI